MAKFPDQISINQDTYEVLTRATWSLGFCYISAKIEFETFHVGFNVLTLQNTLESLNQCTGIAEKRRETGSNMDIFM